MDIVDMLVQRGATCGRAYMYLLYLRAFAGWMSAQWDTEWGHDVVVKENYGHRCLVSHSSIAFLFMTIKWSGFSCQGDALPGDGHYTILQPVQFFRCLSIDPVWSHNRCNQTLFFCHQAILFLSNSHLTSRIQSSPYMYPIIIIKTLKHHAPFLIPHSWYYPFHNKWIQIWYSSLLSSFPVEWHAAFYSFCWLPNTWSILANIKAQTKRGSDYR